MTSAVRPDLDTIVSAAGHALLRQGSGGLTRPRSAVVSEGAKAGLRSIDLDARDLTPLAGEAGGGEPSPVTLPERLNAAKRRLQYDGSSYPPAAC